MSEDRDILDRLSASSDHETNDDATPIPVRIERDPKAVAEAALRQAEEEARLGRDIVREYEEKYYHDGDTTRKRHRAEELAASGWQAGSRKAAEVLHKYDWRPHSRPMPGLSDEERLWAALAHLSALLTLAVAIITSGIAVLVMIFVPLAIYFQWRDRSDFVAFHALQAFGMQLLGTVGWLVVMIAGVLTLSIGIIVSALASLLLVGIPFLIVFVLLLIAFILVMGVLPFVMLVFSSIAAYQTYGGKDYRYPFIASWIDRQVSGGTLTL